MAASFWKRLFGMMPQGNDMNLNLFKETRDRVSFEESVRNAATTLSRSNSALNSPRSRTPTSNLSSPGIDGILPQAKVVTKRNGAFASSLSPEQDDFGPGHRKLSADFQDESEINLAKMLSDDEQDAELSLIPTQSTTPETAQGEAYQGPNASPGLLLNPFIRNSVSSISLTHHNFTPENNANEIARSENPDSAPSSMNSYTSRKRSVQMDWDQGEGSGDEEELLSEMHMLEMHLSEVRELRDSVRNSVAFRTETTSAETSNASQQFSNGSKARLIAVSYRLPLTITVHPDSNEVKLTLSGGGLASAFLKLVPLMHLCWIGMPGINARSQLDAMARLDRSVQRALLHKLQSQGSPYLPMFIDPKMAAGHMAFCNGVLWPLFHHLPLNIDGFRSFRRGQFEAYRDVNQSFADQILEEMQSNDDVIWIHDFQLLLSPEMIRTARPKSKIGLFVHIPFPTTEIYRTLPSRCEILQGMLGANLIGFHTVNYARYFLGSCRRILGLEIRPNGVFYRGRFVHIGVFPMGTDPVSFTKALYQEPVIKIRNSLRAQFKDRRVVVGIDRVDYIKGLPQKMLAIERFLELHPEWLGHVCFVQVGVLSSSTDFQYKQFRNQIIQIVGRINSRFGTLEEMPIHYRETILSFHELCALYSVSDVLLSTSLRDGMNLVSNEFAVCQSENNGVLILSEFTGAALSLPGVLLVNPWNVDEVAATIHQALVMSFEERELRQIRFSRYVQNHSASSWGLRCVAEITKVSS
mmetsp:Transcript_6898/g.12435  ORF Transcript_6898/g.12435 Transcript_6898/m.12435 type:complete len:752 (+) Transcript_6898:43-2298(+)